MPEISRFHGIIIRMYFGDHNPPRFHAVYGEHQAQVDTQTLAMFGVQAHCEVALRNEGCRE